MGGQKNAMPIGGKKRKDQKKKKKTLTPKP
jgi:hypothetical protein